MGIIERTIDVFEKRVSELDEFSDMPELPQWTDADVIAANYLITEYRNLTSRSSRAPEGCRDWEFCDKATSECVNRFSCFKPPPA